MTTAITLVVFIVLGAWLYKWFRSRSLGEKAKDLTKQAQAAVAEHKDTIQDAVDAVSFTVDEKTHGKYSTQITKVGQKANDVVDRLSGEAGADASIATNLTPSQGGFTGGPAAPAPAAGSSFASGPSFAGGPAAPAPAAGSSFASGPSFAGGPAPPAPAAGSSFASGPSFAGGPTAPAPTAGSSFAGGPESEIADAVPEPFGTAESAPSSPGPTFDE
ncbi:MAG: antitoxin [Solirubrobacteraceae bacterium]